MSKKVSPTMIGTFIVGGIIIFIVGLIVFGTGHFFSEKQMYVLYFEGDIKGLSVGAPVAFRGVRIGRVKSIKVIFNQKDLTIRIPVIIEIEKKQFIRLGGTGEYNKPLHEILIDRGLRAQLQVQNLVTGQLMIALDFHPNTPVRLVGGESEYPEIPTIPSSMEELSKTLERLPIDKLINNLLSTLKGIDELVNSPELKNTLISLSSTADTTKELAKKIDKNIDLLLYSINKTMEDIQELTRLTKPLVSSGQTTLTEANSTLIQTKEVLNNIRHITSPDSELYYELLRTLREVNAAARSTRALTDYLRRHPESVIYGK